MLWFEGFVSDCISMVVEVHWNLRCKSESAVVGSAEYVLVGVVNYSNLKYSCWVMPQSPGSTLCLQQKNGRTLGNNSQMI